MSGRIPKSPSLDFDRKQAKALLQGCLDGESKACERMLQHHPRFKAASVTELKSTSLQLSDAQLVVAREYGFPSWPRWKSFVETTQLDLAARAAALLKAVCSNDVSRAKDMLEREPELARYDLFTACACGEPDLVERQLSNNPDLANQRGGPNTWLPLQYACFSRYLRSDAVRAKRIVETVRILLKYRAAPNLSHTPQWQGVLHDNTPLFGAAGVANNAELTKLLLDAGADPNESCPAPDPENPRATIWGTEALYHASEFRDISCLRLLLEAKPHPYRVSYCLGRMVDFENAAGVKLYLEFGADPNFVVPWGGGRTHFLKAVVHGRSPESIAALLDHGAQIEATDAKGISAYRYAIRHGYTEIAELLAQRGARTTDVTESDRQLAAAWRGESVPLSGGKSVLDGALLAHAVQRHDVSVLKRLIIAGADVTSNDSGEHGVPPLHWACWRGKFQAAKVLLEAGADLNQTNCYGGDALGTTMHGSANCFDQNGGPGMKLPEEVVQGEYVEIVEMLLKAGARLPKNTSGASEAVKEVLRSRGVPDAEEA